MTYIMNWSKNTLIVLVKTLMMMLEFLKIDQNKVIDDFGNES